MVEKWRKSLYHQMVTVGFYVCLPPTPTFLLYLWSQCPTQGLVHRGASTGHMGLSKEDISMA
jgi:hypothetical protein